MNKLFINGNYKGIVKNVAHITSSGMLIFELSGTDIMAIALRDDEIERVLSSKICTFIVTKDVAIPKGFDADCFGAELVNNI